MTFIRHKKHATLGVSVKVRNDYADYDYLHKLNKDELLFLKAFHREYVNADFKHKYKKLYKKKKDKQAIYGLNNSRNRCSYNITKWTNTLWFGTPTYKQSHPNQINIFCSLWS